MVLRPDYFILPCLNTHDSILNTNDMQNFPLPRIDNDDELKKLLLPYCRFSSGKIWVSKSSKLRHKIGCIDACDEDAVKKLMENEKAVLAVHDPPYNFVAFQKRGVDFSLKRKAVLFKNNWYHIVVVYNDNLSRLSMFVNNNLITVDSFCIILMIKPLAVSIIFNLKKTIFFQHGFYSIF